MGLDDLIEYERLVRVLLLMRSVRLFSSPVFNQFNGQCLHESAKVSDALSAAFPATEVEGRQLNERAGCLKLNLNQHVEEPLPAHHLTVSVL